jgi:hypothetical protein
MVWWRGAGVFSLEVAQRLQRALQPARETPQVPGLLLQELELEGV